MERTVEVKLADRGYNVFIAPGCLDRLGATATAVDTVSNAVVIADSNVADIYGRRAIGSLRQASLPAAMLTFPAGESNKTLATYGKLFDGLFELSPAIDRDTLIVALGGGVTGDIAGFVAATALRGLRWMLCPTSVLADVDASVGGKTAVDHAAGKNLIGAFHQPAGVLIDVETLRTLPQREFRSGLAECVKHAIIRDAEMMNFIEQNADAIDDCDADVMTDLIARNVEIKAGVVAADETERTGQRAHLNFGHTVGHAIETLGGYQGLTHGEAVAIGIVANCRIAAERGLIDAPLAERVEALLQRLGLPVRCEGVDVSQVAPIMQRDKKSRGGRVRFILPTALGEVDAFDDVSDDEIAAAMK